MLYLAWNIKGMKISMLKFITTSNRAFEEEVMLSGFGNAQVKGEGHQVSFDDAQKLSLLDTLETVALAFAITEEAIEDNLMMNCQIYKL